MQINVHWFFSELFFLTVSKPTNNNLLLICMDKDEVQRIFTMLLCISDDKGLATRSGTKADVKAGNSMKQQRF